VHVRGCNQPDVGARSLSPSVRLAGIRWSPEVPMRRIGLAVAPAFNTILAAAGSNGRAGMIG
jgi:hypothetical protein